MASTFVLALMLPLGYEATIAMTRRGFDLSGDQHVDLHPQVGQSLTLDALTALVFNFCYLSAFAALTIAAICYRQRPAIHKRLMLFANIELIGAPMAHLLGHANLLAGNSHDSISDVFVCRPCQRLPGGTAHSPADSGACHCVIHRTAR